MAYIIYEKSTAQLRHQLLTDDAVKAGYIPKGTEYLPLIIHPNQELAAIVYENTPGVIAPDGTTLANPIRFEGLFTGQELAPIRRASIGLELCLNFNIYK